MNRKKFLQAAALTAVLPSFAKAGAGIARPQSQINTLIPQRLREGDTVMLVSPGGFVKPEELAESRTNLENLGFAVKEGKYAGGKYGYLGGTDKERADDLNTAFADKSVKAIVCTRGGYGCTRILPMLDYELIKANPKVLLGYSDITALFYGIYAKTGLAGYHGPVGISTFNEYSVNHLKNILMMPQKNYKLTNAEADPAKPEYERYTIGSGTAEGRLIGGNLSLCASVAGTEYDVDYTDSIIFLEEVGEEPYRLDRMLTQLMQSGALEKCSGVALGVFSKCNPKGSESGIYNSFTLKEVLFDRLAGLGKPVYYGFSFGHIADKFTLPFGVRAELNASEGKLTLKEPAVL